MDGFVVVRAKDGLVSSLPCDFYRAEGLALYLASVTDDDYEIRRGEERIARVGVGARDAAAFQAVVASDPSLRELFGRG